MWHNSNVNHKAHCLLVVFGLSQWGACRDGKGETGPCMDTEDVGVKQAPAGRDYCNLCHWLNGFPSPRGAPVSWWSTTTVEGPGKWMNTPWAAFWCRLMWAVGVKDIGFGSPREILPAVWLYRTGGVSKDSGWTGSMNRGLQKNWQSTQTSRERRLAAPGPQRPLRNISHTCEYLGWYGQIRTKQKSGLMKYRLISKSQRLCQSNGS